MKCGRIIIIIATILFAIFIVTIVLVFTLRRSQSSSFFNEPTPVERQIKNVIRENLQTLIEFLWLRNPSIPDLYPGCSDSTIRRFRFCGNVKASGSYSIGGTLSGCDVPYGACRAACTLACTSCHIIPFVSCGGPCNDCPEKCRLIREICIGGSAVSWSVNVLEVFMNANEPLQLLDFDTPSIKPNTNQYILSMKLPFEIRPYANVDVRTTGEVGNFQGTVGLGTLRILISMTLLYDCVTKSISLKDFHLDVSGIDLDFSFSNSFSDRLKSALYSLAKGAIESAVKSEMEKKLSDFFRDFIQKEFLPKLSQFPIFC